MARCACCHCILCILFSYIHFVQLLCKGRVLLWDLEQNGRNWVGQEICGHFKSFDTFAGRLGPLAFTNLSAENGPVDSGLMAMPCSDGTVQVMALDTYEQLYTLCPPELQPYDSHQDLSRCAPHRCSLAAFSPCGQWLATTRCSHAAEVHIWEAETGQLIAHIKNSPASIRVMKWVQVPPRGPMLAVGDVSGFCNLYTVFTDGPN